jgi:hypothetical protein
MGIRCTAVNPTRAPLLALSLVQASFWTARADMTPVRLTVTPHSPYLALPAEVLLRRYCLYCKLLRLAHSVSVYFAHTDALGADFDAALARISTSFSP